MKENTKYNQYRFSGKIFIDHIQPWFDFGTAKPWDDPEIPWVLDNKVKRDILTILSKGSMSFDEIYESLQFSPKPLLITQKEYKPNIQYKWSKDTIRNHLSNLEWYNLISLKNGKYSINFPILNLEDNTKLNKEAKKLIEEYLKPYAKSDEQISKLIQSNMNTSEIYSLLIDKIVDEFFLLLKQKGIIPDEPNIKILWAEQLREENFEEWVKKYF
ncbi:MAG: hypothetical protein ACFFD5_01010 [Candidatus Thorarchaeota archaeon]